MKEAEVKTQADRLRDMATELASLSEKVNAEFKRAEDILHRVSAGITASVDARNGHRLWYMKTTTGKWRICIQDTTDRTPFD